MANLIFYAVALFVSMVYFQGDQADARLMPLSEEDQKMVNEFVDRELKRLRDQKGAQMEDDNEEEDDDDDQDNDENEDMEERKSQFRQNGIWSTVKKIGGTIGKIGLNLLPALLGKAKDISNENNMRIEEQA